KQVADKDRLLKDKSVDGDGRHSASGPAPRRYGSGDVYLSHDPAAEDVSVQIGIFGHGHDAQYGRAVSRKDDTVFGAHCAAPVCTAPEGAPAFYRLVQIKVVVAV